MALNQQAETAFGGCPHDCPDTCSMVFDIKDGKVAGVSGNKEHPMTRGGLCVKLKDYEKRHYHPDRLLHPMRRNEAMRAVVGPVTRAQLHCSVLPSLVEAC